MKNSGSFLISALYIDSRYSLEHTQRGGSNQYPQSMFFFSRNKKTNVYPCKLQFYCIKVGFKGRVHTRQGNSREIYFFKVKELSGNSVMS